ncbi:MAG: bifunctional molybdenum cofactor biosynthesis protein MoaC/MoaB [Deltaproteobacteria bacterium]|nr:bifunctional molybdenum cofactor biosynthesis protein MoaC/MoaB [Deltaproteobacteria bacterium]
MSQQDHAQYRMADIGNKAVTRRRAVARGEIRMSERAFAAFEAGELKKGDPRALAEVSGISATKKTSELLPLCHPIAIERVRVAFRTVRERRAIEVFAEVLADGKTGVEMEALTAVSVALLNLYDVLKAEDPVLEIVSTRLEIKEGGKSGRYTHPDKRDETPFDASLEQPRLLAGVAAALITASDRASAGVYEDKSGPALAAALDRAGARVVDKALVSDDLPAIKDALRRAAERAQCVVITGGTGISPRDVTPEAVAALGAEVPGFGELMRSATAARKPSAYLSRCGAWLACGALVLIVPGSERGAVECLDAVMHLIPHALAMQRGDKH